VTEAVQWESASKPGPGKGREGDTTEIRDDDDLFPDSQKYLFPDSQKYFAGARARRKSA
jgi:hypothetical protein